MRAHWAYLKYVLAHKWFVWRAGRMIGVNFWQLLIHDWTKFLPCEWTAYVGSFYNKDGTKRDWKSRTTEEKLAFNSAWNHHQKANPHHWQYWLLTNDSDDPKHKPLPMPPRFRKEMIADWMGAGRAITGKWEVWEWYAKNTDKVILHEDTRYLLEEELDFIRNCFRVSDNLGVKTI